MGKIGMIQDIIEFEKDIIFSNSVRNTEALYCREKQWFVAGTKVYDSELYVIEDNSIFSFRFKKSKRFSVSTYNLDDDLCMGIQEKFDALKSEYEDIELLRVALNKLLKPIVQTHLKRREELRFSTIRTQEEEQRQKRAKFDKYMEAPLHRREDKLQNQINFSMLKKTIAHEMYHDDFFEVMFNNSELITVVYDDVRNEAAVIKKGDAYILYCDYYGSCSHCDAIYDASWKEALTFCKSVANDALCFNSIQDIITFLDVIKDYSIGFYRFDKLADKLLKALMKFLKIGE